MFSVFSTALVGAVVGAAGNFLLPPRHAGGLITAVVIGSCGANIAAALGWQMDWWYPGAMLGYLGGVGGALIMLFGYRVFATAGTE